MSIAYYLVRLWWDGRRGQARYYGAPVILTACPDIGFRIDALDYAPAVDCKVVQPYAWRWRDLEPAEELRVMAFLRSLA